MMHDGTLDGENGYVEAKRAETMKAEASILDMGRPSVVTTNTVLELRMVLSSSSALVDTANKRSTDHRSGLST